jgi:hypothetical protein
MGVSAVIQPRGNRWRLSSRRPATRSPELVGSFQDRQSASARRFASERQLRLQAQDGVVGGINLSRLAEEWASRPRLAPTTQANLLQVSGWLGHSTVQITADVSGHLFPETIDLVIGRLDRALGHALSRHGEVRSTGDASS